MIKNKFITLIVATSLSGCLAMSGCASGNLSKKAKDSAVSSFSELSWESDISQMTEVEGENYETYPSVYDAYNASTYVYPKNYLDKAGTIKYMFDKDDNLCNIAWAFESDSEDEAKEVYQQICSDINSKHGEGTISDGVNNYGQVWKLESGNIIASMIITTDIKIVQVAYLSPAVSKK